MKKRTVKIASLELRIIRTFFLISSRRCIKVHDIIQGHACYMVKKEATYNGVRMDSARN